VTSNAVEVYLQARTVEHAGAKSPREVAADAGLYTLETPSIELSIPVDVLRTLSGISDPANEHLFTREGLAATLLKSGHITPADGNVFEDLGFAAAEAKRLLAEADADIAKEKAPGEGR
jgi:hypothetical protein